MRLSLLDVRFVDCLSDRRTHLRICLAEFNFHRYYEVDGRKYRSAEVGRLSSFRSVDNDRDDL
jgi:hypothetical protein